MNLVKDTITAIETMIQAKLETAQKMHQFNMEVEQHDMENIWRGRMIELEEILTILKNLKELK